MLGRLNHVWSELPAPARYGIAVLVLGGSVFAVAWSLRDEGQVVPAALRDKVVYRQCSSCDHLVEATGAEVYDKGFVGLEMAQGPMGEGRRCPECNQDTLMFVEKCPRDNTVFDPYALQSPENVKPGCCPKCGWDALARRSPAE